jgi:hypothetical protein
VHHLQRRICKAANRDNMLLEQLDVKDELSTLAEEVRRGQRKEGG